MTEKRMSGHIKNIEDKSSIEVLHVIILQYICKKITHNIDGCFEIVYYIFTRRVLLCLLKCI